MNREAWYLRSVALTVLLVVGGRGAICEARTFDAQVDETSVQVALDPAAFALPADALVAWVTRSARAVAGFYGRFPVSAVRVQLISRPGRGVITGRTTARPNAVVRVLVGEASDAADLARDWVMVHELVHLAFPSVAPEHAWIEEGLATYVEPLARLANGDVPVDTVWHDLLDGLPMGLPRAGDRGLDRTRTWGRRYWGGALFCFRADLEIRRRTGNAKGLRDALRAIVEAGGNMSVRWPLARALEIGDTAVGAPVLTELYQEMRESPAPLELSPVFDALGVERVAGRIRLHDSAPLAATRRAIAPGETRGNADPAEIPRKFPTSR